MMKTTAKILKENNQSHLQMDNQFLQTDLKWSKF